MTFVPQKQFDDVTAQEAQVYTDTVPPWKLWHLWRRVSKQEFFKKLNLKLNVSKLHEVTHQQFWSESPSLFVMAGWLRTSRSDKAGGVRPLQVIWRPAGSTVMLTKWWWWWWFRPNSKFLCEFSVCRWALCSKRSPPSFLWRGVQSICPVPSTPPLPRRRWHSLLTSWLWDCVASPPPNHLLLHPVPPAPSTLPLKTCSSCGHPTGWSRRTWMAVRRELRLPLNGGYSVLSVLWRFRPDNCWTSTCNLIEQLAGSAASAAAGRPTAGRSWNLIGGATAGGGGEGGRERNRNSRRRRWWLRWGSLAVRRVWGRSGATHHERFTNRHTMAVFSVTTATTQVRILSAAL